MFGKFSDYMYHLLFTPLKKIRQAENQFYIFFKIAGKLFDDTKADIFRIREESMIAGASEVMLLEHGKDRDMPRLKGESAEGYRARLILKVMIAQKAGTNEGILLSVRALGYEHASIIPRFLQDSQRWAEAVLRLEFPKEGNRRLVMVEVNRVKPASAKFVPDYFDHIQIPNSGRFLLSSLSVKIRIGNYFTRPVRFDGFIKWDGSINFDQQITGRFYLQTVIVRQSFITAEAYNMRLCFPALAVNRKSSTSTLCFRHRISDREDLKPVYVAFRYAAENSNSSRVFLITNTMYTFDGRYNFDGKRRFNAAVTEEEL